MIRRARAGKFDKVCVFLLRFARGTLLKLLGLVNRVLRCTLPSSLRAWVLRSQQWLLQACVRAELDSLPRTGLDGAQTDVAQFGRFCTHALRALRASPRSILARDMARQLKQRSVDDTDVAWLCETLKLGRIYDVSVARARLDELPDGRLHKAYLKAQTAANESAEFPPSLRTTIAKGLREKRGLSGDELERRIRELESTRAATKRKAQDEVARLAVELQSDVTYLTWARAQRIWASDVEPLYAQFRAVDRGVGVQRNEGGESFEVQARDDAFALACARLPPCEAGERHERVENLEWLDADDKHAGELDVGVARVDARSGELRGIVALVELKSHMFELATGYRQQQRHVAAGSRLRVVRDDASQVLLVCDPQTPIFVATTLPSHRFVLGAPPKLIQSIMQHFDEDFRGDEPLLEPHQRDANELAALAETMREQYALGDNSAPFDFMHANPDKVFVIV